MVNQTFQFDNFWLATLLWLIIYPCDYYLTLLGSTLRNQYGKEHIEFEGSYELNPYYQRDINALRKLSPRFLFQLFFWPFWLGFIWIIAHQLDVLVVFSAAFGFLFLPECLVISTHIQNITMFNSMKSPQAVGGKIIYARWLSIKLVANGFQYWSLVFGLFFLLTGSWMFLGGALGALRIYFRFNSMSRRFRYKAETGLPDVK